MIVKGHQPQLHQELEEVFQDPTVLAETMTASETVDSGHGRIEPRRLTTSTALVGYSDWPGLAQVFQVERSVTLKKRGAPRHDVVISVDGDGLDAQGAARHALQRVTDAAAARGLSGHAADVTVLSDSAVWTYDQDQVAGW